MKSKNYSHADRLVRANRMVRQLERAGFVTPAGVLTSEGRAASEDQLRAAGLSEDQITDYRELVAEWKR